MKFDIARYISGADSICREERQYALYLHNVLLGIRAGKITGDNSEKVLGACGLEGAEIVDVFYEATFMRDLFYCDLEKHKKEKTPPEFNEKLLSSICQKAGTLFCNVLGLIPAQLPEETLERARTYHLGMGRGQSVLSWYPGLQIVTRVMMNSKPDLAIVYTRKKPTLFLKFIECKYTSDESGNEIKQTEAQAWIADFLCEALNVSIESTPVKLVRFLSDLNVRKEKRYKKDGGSIIKIEELISMHRELL